MQTAFQVSRFKVQIARLNLMSRNTGDQQLATGSRGRAFTLIELLVVISILGILASLSVPALKSLGKSNIATSASRQMLDDIGHARQMAIGQHTTVYMVFVKTNFWMNPGWPNNPWWNNLTSVDQRTAATNLCEKQLTGYAFVSLRSVGDQPGQGQTRYLSAWQKLPEGNFIASQKFVPHNINNWFTIPAFDPTFKIFPFNTVTSLAFPTEDSRPSSVLQIPYIAFNYLGQLTVDGLSMAKEDEYIPLAQGNVGYAFDAVTKNPIISANTLVKPADITETPPGNSTSSTYNIIHIDRLTGRATMEYRRVQ